MRDGIPAGPKPIEDVGITTPTLDNQGKPDLFELTGAS